MCGYRSGTSAIWICWTAPELTSAIRSAPSLADDHNAVACGTMRCRLRCAFGGVGCGVSGGILATVPAAAVFASLARNEALEAVEQNTNNQAGDASEDETSNSLRPQRVHKRSYRIGYC